MKKEIFLFIFFICLNANALIINNIKAIDEEEDIYMSFQYDRNNIILNDDMYNSFNIENILTIKYESKVFTANNYNIALNKRDNINTIFISSNNFKNIDLKSYWSISYREEIKDFNSIINNTLTLEDSIYMSDIIFSKDHSKVFKATPYLITPELPSIIIIMLFSTFVSIR